MPFYRLTSEEWRWLLLANTAVKVQVCALGVTLARVGLCLAEEVVCDLGDVFARLEDAVLAEQVPGNRPVSAALVVQGQVCGLYGASCLVFHELDLATVCQVTVDAVERAPELCDGHASTHQRYSELLFNGYDIPRRVLAVLIDVAFQHGDAKIASVFKFRLVVPL